MPPMKAVLQLSIHEERIRKKAFVTVSRCPGVASIALDDKTGKMTVVGEVDVSVIVMKLRKLCNTDIVSVEVTSSRKYNHVPLHHLSSLSKLLHFLKMQQNIINVEFKFEIYNERTKRKAMEVIANFTGVTTVEWKENGKLKVKGKFDSHEMTTKFKKICKHIAIFKLTTDEGPDQNRAMVMYEPRQEQNQAPVTRREPRQELNHAVTRREPQEQNRVRFTRREPRQEQNRAMVIWRETRPEHNPHPRGV